MKIIYTAFVKQLNYGERLIDLMFVSLDKKSWLEITPIDVTIDYYQDVKKLFKGNGRTFPMRIDYSFIQYLASLSKNNIEIKEIK